VALAFLTRQPALFAIPKAAKPDHARENAAAADLSLSAGDVARIEAAFPLGKRKGRLGIS
jgi:diketogulonate reductase-like aldo/keto reductase